MNAAEHIEAAEAWLETGENAWRRFTYDKAPRDPGEMRKAEVAIGLAQAHAALAALVDRPAPIQLRQTEDFPAPNGRPIPVTRSDGGRL
ncbi:MAG TPA: hypothetical protein VGL02_00380 [Streptomyces sp.]